MQRAYLYVIKDSEERFPNFCQVTDEVVSLSNSDQVIQGQAANRKKTTHEKHFTATVQCSHSASTTADRGKQMIIWIAVTNTTWIRS